MTLRRLLSRYTGFSGMAAKEFLAYNIWFWMNLFTPSGSSCSAPARSRR